MKAKLYSLDVKCNKTGKVIKGKLFVGKDKQDALEVVEMYCQDEDATIMTELSLVNKDFELKPVEMDMELVTDDLEDSIFDALDGIAAERTIAKAANDD